MAINTNSPSYTSAPGLSRTSANNYGTGDIGMDANNRGSKSPFAVHSTDMWEHVLRYKMVSSAFVNRSLEAQLTYGAAIRRKDPDFSNLETENYFNDTYQEVAINRVRYTQEALIVNDFFRVSASVSRADDIQAGSGKLFNMWLARAIYTLVQRYDFLVYAEASNAKWAYDATGVDVSDPSDLSDLYEAIVVARSQLEGNRLGDLSNTRGMIQFHLPSRQAALFELFTGQRGNNLSDNIIRSGRPDTLFSLVFYISEHMSQKLQITAVGSGNGKLNIAGTEITFTFTNTAVSAVGTNTCTIAGSADKAAMKGAIIHVLNNLDARKITTTTANSRAVTWSGLKNTSETPDRQKLATFTKWSAMSGAGDVVMVTADGFGNNKVTAAAAVGTIAKETVQCLLTYQNSVDLVQQKAISSPWIAPAELAERRTFIISSMAGIHTFRDGSEKMLRFDMARM